MTNRESFSSPRITLLGTGNAGVTKCYNTCFLLEDAGQLLLVDAGGGNRILEQLERVEVDITDIHDIFVTHKHIDHLLGVVWLVRMACQKMVRSGYTGHLTIYGHDEVIGLLTDMTQRLLDRGALIGRQLHFVEVRDGETLTITGREITFFDIRSTKAKQFGFTLRLSNGKKLTCCGDEPYAPHEEPYAAGSDWLLHEAFCLLSEADQFKPYQKAHSTVKDACEVAARLQIPNLVLYHTEDKNLARRKELYAQEGRAYYAGNLYIPDDLETIEL